MLLFCPHFVIDIGYVYKLPYQPPKHRHDFINLLTIPNYMGHIGYLNSNGFHPVSNIIVSYVQGWHVKETVGLQCAFLPTK